MCFDEINLCKTKPSLFVLLNFSSAQLLTGEAVLKWEIPVFNIVELGQAIWYHSKKHKKITYWIIWLFSFMHFIDVVFHWDQTGFQLAVWLQVLLFFSGRKSTICLINFIDKLLTKNDCKRRVASDVVLACFFNWYSSSCCTGLVIVFPSRLLVFIRKRRGNELLGGTNLNRFW